MVMMRASPDRVLDFFVHKPGIDSFQGSMSPPIVTPALGAETRVEAAGQERGTGKTSRPAVICASALNLPDKLTCALTPYARIGRSPGHKTVTCDVGRDGCVEVI